MKINIKLITSNIVEDRVASINALSIIETYQAWGF